MILQFNMGGPVPKSYYFSCNKPVPTSDMVAATILSGNKLKLKFEVTSPVILRQLTILRSISSRNRLMTFYIRFRWEFFTEEGDIGFGIHYKKDNKKIDIIPVERIDTHLFKQEGEIVCKELCTCKQHVGNNNTIRLETKSLRIS